ncbi:hypothetical protein SUGI_0701970 [Cryptomeria japonica]|uniref:F-box/kelch-repeat protein At1g80440-like n=1 Tax=Cryptomeria japonica TaxID=3369 RepID=UPI002414B91B|nr:F-box/kelch-repeat protein At1g80440-like [Cryptomeria japonica]GLJ34866.1 hypothetical protein SUGI_0701970 [Cryptomeria japonica]
MEFLQEISKQIVRDKFKNMAYKSGIKKRKITKPMNERMECFQLYKDRNDIGMPQKYICLLQRAGITIYDPVDHSWERLPPNPTGIQISFVSRLVCVNHKLVLMGLKHHEHETRRILVYDFETSTWQQGAEIPTATSSSMFACCASPEGSIYIAGGLGQCDNSFSDAAVYKVDEDKWEILPKMHQEIGFCRGVFIEGLFYAIGIFNNRAQRFNPSTREWTTLENTLGNSKYVQFLYAFGQLYAFGGEGVEKYDWEGEVWRELEPLPQQLSFIRATVWCDRIFLSGYKNTSLQSGHPVFYMYKPGAVITERWIAINKPESFVDMEILSVATIQI